MSGALAVAIGAAGGAPTSITVTVADQGGGTFGGPPFSPSTYQGSTIVNLESFTSFDFRFTLRALVASYFIKGLFVVDGTGATRWYASAAATVDTVGGSDTRWTWGSGSSKVWTAAHGSKVVTIIAA